MKRLVNTRGFTLVELVIIVIIVAVVAILVSMQSSDLYTIKLSGAARKLASDIRFAQQLAMTTQNLHGVVLNIPAANQYTVYEQDDPTDPARNPTGGNDFIVDYTSGEFDGVTVSTTLPQDSSSRRLVKFNSRGEAIGGDNNPLSAPNNTITLSYQGGDKDITIEPTTGRISY
jgi:type II secretory pathway pseudopilin PulG